MIAIKKTSKKIVQDIVPSERRSIRNIKITHEEEPPVKVMRKKVLPKEEDYDEETVEPIFPKKTRVKKSSGIFKYLISFFIIFVSLGVIGVALSLSYSKALVTITPKVVYFDVDGIFTAKKSTPEITNDDLKYESITASDQITETVPATKGVLLQTKAKGSMYIYNKGNVSQVLVAGTRLATTNGLVYRIVSTITVPAQKGTVPGSISVNIISDQAGEKYNTSDTKSEYKVLGYKGTPKYELFYAKLKSNVVGGFSGNKITVDPEIKKQKIEAMESLLEEKLISKIKSIVPENYILYDTAYNVEYEVPEPVMNGSDNAEITIKGTAYAAIFNSNALIKYIAGKEIKKFPSETYRIDGDNKLTFKISNTKDFSVKKSTPLLFTLKGPISITGTFSEEKLKEELKGKKAKLGNTIFAKYPAISNAFAQITPFWMNSFPDDVKNITIEYKAPSK